MADKLLTLAFDFGLLTIYILIGFIGFMTIQLISYKVFKFNLYKWLITKLQLNWIARGIYSPTI